jgi:hypothetical protein
VIPSRHQNTDRVFGTHRCAAPGKLKSALATDIAIHLAFGIDWRGYQSKETCGVVYFALERADLVKRRLAAHRRRDDLTGLPIAVAGGIINLMEPKSVGTFVTTIRESAIASRSSHREICSSSRSSVRGPQPPIETTTITIAKAIRPNTPFVPAVCRKKPMMKLANTALIRLRE